MDNLFVARRGDVHTTFFVLDKVAAGSAVLLLVPKSETMDAIAERPRLAPLAALLLALFPSTRRPGPGEEEGAETDSDTSSDSSRAARKRQRAEQAAREEEQDRAAALLQQPSRVASLHFYADIEKSVLGNDRSVIESLGVGEEGGERDAALRTTLAAAAASCSALRVTTKDSPPPSSRPLLLLVSVVSPGNTLSVPFFRSDRLAADVDLDARSADLLHPWMDARVFTMGTDREAGGPTAEEQLDNMRRRHASGSFTVIVEPTATLQDVVNVFFAMDKETQRIDPTQALRMKRHMGSFPNENVVITLKS